MKNLKKVIFALMVVFLVVGFIGCKTESDPPKTPVVTNNFKGKTFLGMTGEGEDAYYAGYIIFTSDKDCEVMFFDEEPMPATYTVADDVATLTGTGEYAVIQLSTTKLTDGKFSITIPPAVSKQENDIVVSYEVGTLWTILYDIPDSDEDFSWKMPEEELEAAVENFGFEEDDYTKDDTTKTITLTASGWAKVQAAMGGGSEDEEGGEVTGWTVMYNGTTVETFESFEEVETFGSSIELVEDDDYTVDYENQIITLTDAGAEKVQDAMGGDTEGGDSGEVYYYMHNGELYGGQNTLEDFLYEVELYGLVEGTDYTIDHENMCINFTDSGCAKLEG